MGSWVLLLVFVLSCNAFVPEMFRKCKDSSFCRRNRGLAPNECAISGVGAPRQDGSHVRGELVDSRSPHIGLEYDIISYSNGVFRFQVRETSPLRPHYVVQDVLLESLGEQEVVSRLTETANGFSLENGAHGLVVELQPVLKAVLTFNGVPTIVLNDRGLLYVEHFRDRSSPSSTSGVPRSRPVDESDLWEENFRGHADSKPFGPQSLGMDISFLGAYSVYGIPERASSFSLSPTRGEGAPQGDPYRLYTLDVFEYEVSNPEHNTAPLYGAVPIMHALHGDRSSAVLWLNAAETFVDVEYLPTGKGTHWFSEAGIVDVFLFAAETPSFVTQQIAVVTGTTALPPLFSLGYHQCRWNYRDENDVLEVNAGFDQHDIAYDVLWLDIEHTNGKRYFTWDRNLFPNPVEMQNKLAESGRKMVTIIDPHLKVDASYGVFLGAYQSELLVQAPQGGAFQGACWAGESAYLDFTNPAARQYWASQFPIYEGSTEHLFTWNDMNEPSVFNGPEISMMKDAVHGGGVEHREVHNLYGFYMTMATYEGQLLAYPNRRPFVLTRSVFAGSQRYAAVWTGDNMAKWEHLAKAQPMLLSLSMAGQVFCGADVGGFFYNPDAELLVRWYQAAAFHPFFRGHAHLETQRREPWLFGKLATKLIRKAIDVRYRLLPYLYSLFYQSHVYGLPVMRPLFFEFPARTDLYGVEDQFMLGNILLVKPVTVPNAESGFVYLPESDIWYDFYTGTPSPGSGNIQVATPVDKIIVFQRSGTILPQRLQPRPSSALMANDSYTLTVAPDWNGEASGFLFADDGSSFNYQEGNYLLSNFSFSRGTLTALPANTPAAPDQFYSVRLVDRVVILGIQSAPKAVHVQGGWSFGGSMTFRFDAPASSLVISKPLVRLDMAWTLSVEW